MTNHIEILEDNLINKIAAGEVIESPSSVVKELIENAIDAKGTKIYIEIKKAGLELIRVEDDGIGMNKNDALLCFKRHATSKIKSFDDLINVSSMGFRGEALASIAAVSKIDLKTSTKDIATFVKMDASKMISISEIARTKGTSIDVKHLFFNVPVRRKFQKTYSYINSEIIKIVICLALSHPKIEFKLVLDEKEQILTPSFLDEEKIAFKKRVQNLLSKEFSQSSYLVDYSIDNINIFGLIGSPHIAKKTRSVQYLIINNRVVSSYLIAKFIKLAYATRISEDDFPIFAINIKMPSSFIDINVHPQKKEIRLREYLFIKEAINKAIDQAFEKDFLKKEDKTATKAVFNSDINFTNPKVSQDTEVEKVNIFQKYEKQMLFDKFFDIQNIIDEFLQIDNFIFIESKYLQSFIDDIEDEKMVIIDLGAIFTTDLFEKIKNRKNFSKSQKLLVPINITLCPNDITFVEDNIKVFVDLGFELHRIGKDQIVIEAIDEIILREDLNGLFFLILEDLKQYNKTDKVDALYERELAKKLNSFAKTKSFSTQEAINLLNLFINNKMSCFDPLGNKILINVSKDQIERQFFKNKR